MVPTKEEDIKFSKSKAGSEMALLFYFSVEYPDDLLPQFFELPLDYFFGSIEIEEILGALGRPGKLREQNDPHRGHRLLIDLGRKRDTVASGKGFHLFLEKFSDIFSGPQFHGCWPSLKK
jgi:hypothetical protein